MVMPKRLQVGPFKYTVQPSKHLLSNAEKFGMTVADEQVIRVDPGLPADTSREVLLHETLHALWDLVDLKRDWPDGDGEAGERIIARLSPALLDLLRRNPAFVQFLLSQ